MKSSLELRGLKYSCRSFKIVKARLTFCVMKINETNINVMDGDLV
jgi:hypothetical protein